MHIAPIVRSGKINNGTFTLLVLPAGTVNLKPNDWYDDDEVVLGSGDVYIMYSTSTEFAVA
jgi:hypothetical protein